MSNESIFSKIKSSATDKGSKRILIVAGVVIVGAVGYSVLSQPAPVANPSTVAGPPRGATTVQGGNQVTPAYNEALSTADKQRIEDAAATGKSAMPTVRASNQDQVVPVLDLDPKPEEAPQVELPVVQQPVVVQQPLTQAVPIVQAPQPIRSKEDTRNLQDYMMTLRRGYAVAEVVPFSNGEVAAPAEQVAPPSQAVAEATQDEGPAVDLPLAGTIVYAEMVSRANSDAPGPVLARVLQGKYAGATLIGSFKTVENALVISFDRMTVGVDKDGNEINATVPLNAVAVDTSYVGTALATSVDRHLFQKLAIGFTAGFAQGFGDALANSGRTRIINSDGTTIDTGSDLDTNEQLLAAGGKAVSEAGGILMSEFGKRPTTVMVESGTSIGVLFL